MVKLCGGVYGVRQPPLGVYLAAEAESERRVKSLESVQATELLVKWTCAVGLREPWAEKKPTGPDEFVFMQRY